MHKSMEQQNREDHREDDTSTPRLTADHIKAKMPRMGLPSYYRYFAIDLDGSTDFTGYVQRPAAERNILRAGLGIWDNREGRILVWPDEDVRFERLATTLASQRRDVAETEAKCDELRTFLRERRAGNV